VRAIMLPDVNVAISGTADVAHVVVAVRGKVALAEMAAGLPSDCRLRGLANHRRSCTYLVVGRSATLRCYQPRPFGRQGGLLLRLEVYLPFSRGTCSTRRGWDLTANCNFGRLLDS